MTDDQPGPVGDSDPNPTSVSPRKPRRRWVGRFFIVVGVVALVIVAAAGTVIFIKISDSNEQKDQIAEQQASFYALPAEIPAAPGSIIRFEPVGYSVVGGAGFRIIYTSQDQSGKPVAVSGRVFLPSAPAPPGGRKVLAWAHGTIGLASKCAPSRQDDPVGGDGWLEPALQQGWVVASTDYLGLGVEGPDSFLVGGQEARDVVNGVRAARNFQGSETGKDWIVWGASQGGHSALWTGTEAEKIAPELNLVAVGAAAPAVELTVLMDKQWNQWVSWVTWAKTYTSWSATYPDRDFSAPLTPEALKQNDALNQKCNLGDGITGLVEEKFGNNFFKADPITDPTWSQTILEQTPRPLPETMPLFVAQSTDDKFVLEGSSALLQQQWCAAGVTMYMDWLGGVQHQNTQNAGGPAFIEWAFNRFAGKPAPKNCTFPPPSPIVAFAPVTPTPPVTPKASSAAKP